MKNITKPFVLALLFVNNLVFAQLQGEFNYAQNGRIYFCLTNH